MNILPFWGKIRIINPLKNEVPQSPPQKYVLEPPPKPKGSRPNKGEVATQNPTRTRSAHFSRGGVGAFRKLLIF